MEQNQTPITPVDTPQVVVEQPKQSNFLVILLSALLFISVVIAGFFALQTQKLVKELTLLRAEPTPVANVESTIEPVATQASEVDPTANWKMYTNTKYSYSLKYPQSYDLVKGPDEDRPDEYFQTVSHIDFNSGQTEGDSIYGSGVALSVMVNPTDKNYGKIICISNKDCIEKYRLNVLSLSPENVEVFTKIIDNRSFTGFKYSASSSLYTQDHTYLAMYNNGDFYLILYSLTNEANRKFENTVDQILSTFKFTN